MIGNNSFRYPTGDEAYHDLLALVHDQGEPVSPRGQLTRELRHVTVVLDDPALAPPLAVRWNFNHGIAAVETVQLLAGVSCLSQLDEVSKGRFSRYADGGRLLGAYGPRLYRQFPEAERRLRADPDTRQAVLNLWRLDEPVTRDVPCTLSLTFAVRKDRLELTVHMRSNDLTMGVPYDWFVFSRVHLAMAEVLGLEPGPYVHKVDSLHLYERDFETAQRLHRDARLVESPRFGTVTVPPFSFTEVSSPVLLERYANPPRHESWGWLQIAAWHLLQGTGDGAVSTDNWYARHVPPLSVDVDTCTDCRYVESIAEMNGQDGFYSCVSCQNEAMES